MRGLQKINSDLYQTEDGYTLVKKYQILGKRMHKINKLTSPEGIYL